MKKIADMPEKDRGGEETGVKDENAVNHEIATLLLNLASRTHSADTKIPVPVKQDPDVAMDLSNYAKSTTSSSESTAITGKHVSPTSSNSSYHSQNSTSSSISSSYSWFPLQPTVATNSLSCPISTQSSSVTSLPPTLSSPLPSYILQNLLIGKMQQQLSTSTDRVTTTAGTGELNGKPVTGPVKQQLPPAKPPMTVLPTNIPLLSGQIVAQLNALLFSIQGLTDKEIEGKVEGQLTAIFSRLQEIVALVQMTKQGSNTDAKMNGDETKEELKLARHIDEYQSVMINSSSKPGKTVCSVSSAVASSVTPVESSKLESQLRVMPPFSKEYLLNDTSRKCGLPPRDSFSDGSPPEKRIKASPDDCSSSSSPSGPPRKTSKGGKGIRNRVFCGDCPGCLKNDDCGQCRYCRDKTKFGGQNRLRQKCLHRRCQMDTHRRSAAGQAAVVATQANPAEPAIYSGLELARLASHTEDDRPQYTSIIDSSPVSSTAPGHITNGHGQAPSSGHTGHMTSQSGHVSSPEPEGSQNSHQSRIDKWKAKHQAMLKLAAEGKDHGIPSASPSPPPEPSKLVITLDKEEAEKELKETARFASRPLSTALVV